MATSKAKGAEASRCGASSRTDDRPSSKPTNRMDTPSRESSGGKKARAGKTKKAAATAAAEVTCVAIGYRTIKMNGLTSHQRSRIFGAVALAAA